MVEQHLPWLEVVRLGHRIDRDKRITSHLGLTARALGADGIVLCGDEDPNIIETWNNVSERFGGPFSARYESRPMAYLKSFKKGTKERPPGIIIHLTMYGEEVSEALPKIRRDRPVALVVGGAKVPGELFGISNHNVAVGNQPHSEVAALAVALSQWHSSVAIESRFKGGSIRVVPSREGKNVVDKKSTSES
ncbi:MAG: tRNA (cytidine(56)-2'-O)-methyltransferase [Euryarchaeota archaeon]|nr:tRNA (cytidine(56)-2'-O)-methyltransferase [Euryarchaeota archaeon]